MPRILIRALIVQLSEKMPYRVRHLNGPLLWFWWRHGFAVVWSEKILASRCTRFICRLLGQVIYTDYLHRWSDVIAHRFRLFKQIKLIGCPDFSRWYTTSPDRVSNYLFIYDKEKISTWILWIEQPFTFLPVVWFWGDLNNPFKLYYLQNLNLGKSNCI